MSTLGFWEDNLLKFAAEFAILGVIVTTLALKTRHELWQLGEARGVAFYSSCITLLLVVLVPLFGALASPAQPAPAVRVLFLAQCAPSTHNRAR